MLSILGSQLFYTDDGQNRIYQDTYIISVEEIEALQTKDL